jgi:chromosome segregation ATPase
MLGQQKRNKLEDGLHNDLTMHEYQNRCLISKVKEQKEEITSIKSQLEVLKTQNSFLSKAFMEVNCRLLSMVDSLSILETEIEGEETKSEDQNIVLVGLDLLKSLKGNFSYSSNQLSEQHASMLENIRNNIELIVAKLLGGFKQVSFPTIEKELKDKLSHIEKKFQKQTHEISIIEAESLEVKSRLQEKEKELEEISSKVSVLSRKVICNPMIPYIKWSKELFSTAKPEHACICHVCGEDFNTNAQFGFNPINSYPNDNLSKLNSQVLINSNSNLDSDSLNVSIIILNYI